MNINNNKNLIQLITITSNKADVNIVVLKICNELNELFYEGISNNGNNYNCYLVSISTDMVASIDLLKLHYFIKTKYMCRTCDYKIGKEKCKIFTTKSYSTFLRNKYKRVEENKFVNLHYYSHNLLSFDCLHTLNNAFGIIYKNDLGSNYNMGDFKMKFSFISFYYFNLNEINKYNMVTQNYIYLNIIPLLLINIKSTNKYYNS